jgi:hypothetical protein
METHFRFIRSIPVNIEIRMLIINNYLTIYDGQNKEQIIQNRVQNSKRLN